MLRACGRTLHSPAAMQLRTSAHLPGQTADMLVQLALVGALLNCSNELLEQAPGGDRSFCGCNYILVSFGTFSHVLQQSSCYMQDYFNEEDDDDPRRGTSSAKRPSSPELHSEGVGRPFVKMRPASPPSQRPPSKVPGACSHLAQLTQYTMPWLRHTEHLVIVYPTLLHMQSVACGF